MDDKNTDILSRYGLKPIRTGRQRGAIMVQTEEGLYLLREFDGNEKHLEFEEKLLRNIAVSGDIHVDHIIRNVDGELIDKEDGGRKYIVRKWYCAMDCDAKNHSHIIRAAKALAQLHSTMNSVRFGQEYLETNFNLEDTCDRLLSEFEKHNRELKRTRNYIRQKRRKNPFESMVLQKFDVFYEDAGEVLRLMAEPSVQQFIINEVNAGRLVHGAYNYHNILFENDGIKEYRPFITNFERAKCSVQVRDLYDFIRKVMEKHSWDKQLGNAVIEEYAKIRSVSDEELKYLALKLKYPEKYWKLLNHYYNNNKAWVPDKDIVKLDLVMRQRAGRVAFIDSMGVPGH